MKQQILFSGISYQEFLDDVKSIIEDTHSSFNKTNKEIEFLSKVYRKGIDVIHFAGISYPTLHRYVKKGQLKKYEINGNPRYSTEEIVKLIKQKECRN